MSQPFANRAGSDAPAIAETILMRLEHIQKGIEGCHVLVGQIEERLRGAQPSGSGLDKAVPPQGMHGMALDVRTSVQTLTSRLEQIVGLLA